MKKILKFNYLYFTLFILLNSSISGQNMSIFGNVLDTLNNTPKKNTVVMLVRLSDSVMIDFKRTDDNGGFYFTESCFRLGNSGLYFAFSSNTLCYPIYMRKFVQYTLRVCIHMIM